MQVIPKGQKSKLRFLFALKLYQTVGEGGLRKGGRTLFSNLINASLLLPATVLVG